MNGTARAKIYPSDPAVLEEFYGWLEKNLMQFSDDPKWQYRVTVASGEAFTNAIFHGNRSQPDKQVRVDIELSDSVLWVKVGDQGEGSPPKARKKSGLFDTSGRGWELMHQMADAVKTGFTGGFFWVELGFKMPKNIEEKRGKSAGKIGTGG
jgi:anti-sigma regulatory factor (Ser/Thr protein kinase)